MLPPQCKLRGGFVALGLILLAGCSGSSSPPPPIQLDTGGISPRVDYAGLDQALQDGVDDDGRLQAEGLTDEICDRLDEQLRLLAVTGPTVTPELFPSVEDRICYWYNVRSAWAIKLAITIEFDSRQWGPCCEGRKFPVDGRLLCLGDIDDILTRFPDWRVAVASPGVSMYRAPLPQSAFQAEGIRARIDRRLTRFLGDSDRFEIDPERRVVVFPPVMWDVRKRILGEHRRMYGTRQATLVTALLDDVGGIAHRRLQDALGYRVVRPTGRKRTFAFLPEL